MELSEFKEIWRSEQQELQNELGIREQEVKAITKKFSQSKLERYLIISIIGRNLALVYFVISMWLASKVFSELPYSIPAIIGGLAMLYSFYQHLPLRRANYSTMSIIELQKAIEAFRIHSLKYANYDKAVVALWFLTVAPIYLKLNFKILIYSNITYFLIFIGIAIVIYLILKIIPFDIYDKHNSELKDAEMELRKIEELEKD